MPYLYGDSTDSPFTSNVLELLRDAIDLSVYLLEADGRIRAGRDRMEVLQEQAQVDLVEVDDLSRAVGETIEATSKSAAESPVARCAAQMKANCDEVAQAVGKSVRAQLAVDMERAEEEEAMERAGCTAALMKLLVPHRPPDASVMLRVRLRETGRYDAWLEGSYPGVGLTWKCELGFPAGHLFNQSLRVDHVQQGLDVHAPELTGWIKKEVKIRPQHLERYTITEVDAQDSEVVVRLRDEPNGATGFDLTSDPDAGRITAIRVGADASAGPFDVEASDAPKLIALCQEVQKSLADAKRQRLTEAKYGDVDFHRVPTFVDVVERLIRQLSSMAHEIARHSLEPDELVLRFRLSDDRREEIFVSKTTLREKYEQLPENMWKLFDPLGLRAPLSRSLPPREASEAGAAAVRSELPPSRPPPAPKQPDLLEVPPKSAIFDVPPPEAEPSEQEWDSAGHAMSK
jgi:hypothetical protein